MMSLKRVLLTILIISVLIPVASSQQEIKESNNQDSLKASSPHSGFVAGGFGSNLLYLGNTISDNQPFAYTSLVYGFRDEFYLSFSSFHIFNNKPFFPFFNESLSYSHTVNSWFDYAFTLSGYQADKSWADTIFSNLYYADATAGFDWKILYTKVSAGALFSDENDFYFQLRNSRYFETPEFARGRFNISFDPYVNAAFGTYYTYTGSEKSATQVAVNPNARKQKVYSETKFGILEVDFALPVSLNSDRVSVEAEAGYVLPINSDEDMPDIRGFTILISAYLKIF